MISRSTTKSYFSLGSISEISGVRRFRPIFLTSITTFAGLTPLIFDSNANAQLLKPMAISLGYGILFATFITLLLIALGYLLMIYRSRKTKEGMV